MIYSRHLFTSKETQGVENNVYCFTIPQHYIDSKKIILSLDLFLSLTISFEGFGLSIAEAMSVGTPILATDVGAVNEFFDNNCGKLIKFSQIEEIKNV